MSTSTYDKALNHIRRLTLADQLRLLEELAAIVRRQVIAQPRPSILSLQGLGKEIWSDVDAQEYVDQERASWEPPRAVRETNVQYVVNTNGQCVAVLLPIQEYEHYLDLLADEADSQDPELAARLDQASSQPTGGERQSFRDYLRQQRESV